MMSAKSRLLGGNVAGDGGALKAQEIKRGLVLDDERLSRRQVEDRILTSEPPLFFEFMLGRTKENIESFNSELGLVGDHAFTFTPSGCEFSFGRKLNPLLIRKVMFRHPSLEVIVRTTVVRGYIQKVTETTWRFTVEHGDLALDGKNVIDCADALMDGIEKVF
jgi:hypothetical protein